MRGFAPLAQTASERGEHDPAQGAAVFVFRASTCHPIEAPVVRAKWSLRVVRAPAPSEVRVALGGDRLRIRAHRWCAADALSREGRISPLLSGWSDPSAPGVMAPGSKLNALHAFKALTELVTLGVRCRNGWRRGVGGPSWMR